MKKTIMGMCPYCGSYHIDYNDMDYDGCTIRHTCICKECGKEFDEFEETIYRGYGMRDENGEYFDYDENGDLM